MTKKIIKKICAMALVIYLICLAAFAAGEVLPATHAELLQWRDEIWAQTRHLPVYNDPLNTYDPTGSATYLIQLESYTVESISPTLDVEENPILSVTFNDTHAQGPRGTGLGMWAEEILAAYPNDNPALIGNQEFAALYVSDAAWGLVMRDHRGLLNIEYGLADGFDCIILSYVIADGQVSDMRVSGFSETISPEELSERIAMVRGVAADNSFDPETAMLPPLHAEMFHPGDLVFSGLDFLNETEQSMYLKEVEQSLYMSRFDGDPGLEIGFMARRFEGEDMRLESLRITDPKFEGPRGLRVGDPLLEALTRFRSEDPAYQGPLTILYAPGETMKQPPFGLLEMHADGGATITYATPVPGDEDEAVMLQITVEDLHITELYISYRWKGEG
ncbi:MAG: hypothetical protein FWD25_05025 [Clostridia bacterium]|nr:hypothetical protein [Clostridia bacterium]